MLSTEIETFKGFMEIEERSHHTIRQYLDILDWFENFLRESNIPLESLKEKDLMRFQIWLKKRYLERKFFKKFNKKPSKQELENFSLKAKGLSGKSIYKYLTVIKKFLEVNDFHLNWTRVPSPKVDDDFNPNILTKADIQKIANTAANYCTYQHQTVTVEDCTNCRKYREPKNPRAAAQRKYPQVCFYFEGVKLKTMILLAYEAALRTGELCKLLRKHVDLHDREVFIQKPLKHSQPQAIPISNSLVKLLKEYLQAANIPKDDGSVLFPTKTGKVYHPNNFASHVFRPIARAAGYDVRYYSLRHSRATNLLLEGLDVGWVRRITRHKNINNVLKYIHLTSKDIRKEMEKRDLL
ncbi:MAG: tyrosine-type recombinase/integrase [Candidatus Heimdallarchaeota archaeon]|nr:tyrosine-type recombinase/integrase [Candidatus Heimdallarchaeota archaeon]